MKPYIALLIIASILVIDQVTKIWVKTHMALGQEITVTSWFIINFVENPGMAFGMVLPGVWGKLFLSAFRLAAATGGVWFLLKILKSKEHPGFITAVCLILAGAIGNMIDGTFYGVIFTDSYGRVAEMFPQGGGYGGWMHGLVVDMAQVKLFTMHIPEWWPGSWGGRDMEFFPFIFNVADAAITIGVFVILIFQKKFFKDDKVPVENTEPVVIVEGPAPVV